jgi:hypothetical protein
MDRQAPISQPRKRRTPWVLIGSCAAIVGGICLAGVAVAAYLLYFRDRIGPSEEPAVAYILDTSTRMGLATEEGSRLAVAQAVMAEVVRPASPSLTSGLRVFGSGGVGQACSDTELVVPFARANQSAIADELAGLQVGAAAESPLAQAMIAAIQDLDRTRGPHSIVVVTGGADSCSPQAGELIAREAERAGIQVQTYVVGFQVQPEEASALKAMVEDTPGATFYDAPDATALRSVLATIQRRIESPTASGEATGQTACDHPYLPLRQGASWTYASDGYSYTWTVSSVSGDQNNATAMVVMGFEGGSLSYEWKCGTDGVFYYTLGDYAFGDTGGAVSFRITSQSGTPLLAPESFQPGASWTNQYTITIEAGVEGFSTTSTTEVNETHTAGPQETVTMGAGTFDAIPITTNSTSTTTSDFGSFTTSYTSTCWFARGVGLVRCESSSEGFSSVTELVSYSVP